MKHLLLASMLPDQDGCMFYLHIIVDQLIGLTHRFCSIINIRSSD